MKIKTRDWPPLFLALGSGLATLMKSWDILNFTVFMFALVTLAVSRYESRPDA